jgi:phosphatidylglycerol---prolipoprotein diacylglyceryl transferase
MHFPVSIQIGNTSILLHVICEIAAFSIAFRYYLYLRKRTTDVIPSGNRTWIIIGAVLGSLIGSRLVGGLEDITALRTADNLLMHFYNNKTVVGGFVGGLAGVEIVKKMIGEKRASGDLFTYPMILGLIIGRIGCFSTGIYEETYGLPTTAFTGMDLGDGIMRHPVSLYEIVFLAVTWISIAAINKTYSLQNGSRFKLFMIAYLLFRFTIDFIKPHYNIAWQLSTIQLVCLAGLLYYSRYIVNPKLLINKPMPVIA